MDNEILRVRKIREADYGCEERPEGTGAIVLVYLETERGEEIPILHSDDLLYEREIREGDLVWRKTDGSLEKACV